MSLNSVTLEMLEMLPSWMKMKRDPENSTGAQFLDIAGKQLYDMEMLAQNILYSHQLSVNNGDGINIAEIDIIYKTEVPASVVIGTIEVEGLDSGTIVPLDKAITVYDFYSNLDKYYIDTDSHTLYVRKKFDNIVVNGASFPEIIEHSIWGPYDEIGLLFGCPRISGERNYDKIDEEGVTSGGYRERLLDVFQNKGNATRKGLINYISRSLSIDQEDIVVEELSESFVRSLINPDGTIKDELKSYMLLSNKVNLASSDVYWEILEENRSGLSYLPIVWDAPLDKWNNDSIQNGVSEAEDLKVIGPDQTPVKQKFDYHVGVEGLKLSKKTIYPEHKLSYRIFAKGQKYDNEFKPEAYQYLVTASELVHLKFKVKAYKKYSHNIQLDFNGPLIDFTLATSGDKKLNSYVGKNVVIKKGSEIMNKNARYIEILANLDSNDGLATPEINSITLDYTTSGNILKKIVIDNETTQSVNGNIITTGFETNTWVDTDPMLRVRSGAADQHLTNYDNTSSSLKLTQGNYQKIYDSEGDWDDGEKMNLRVSSIGTLKLSI